MDIGKPQRTRRIEPVENPIPQRETKPTRRPLTAPTPEPATPDKTPSRKPVKR